ncbi:hypothetical protein E3P92_02805 [Wallemia ichthyophaga]|uniref:DNA-directed RNA polymerase subunit beta n=2 Tax=Wallemia ichthyophaga TaxID=245174 RepID=A0A4T0G9L3_WALIC|nr:hypothetical protein E3P91_03112 [Wallemia ichthyophaga]TIA80695.1 hypothetical protein E3P98_02548 [Wallemia ichthyophaga]TIA89274.1 hypothetical protein E3P97_03133 [Wallemia ichthyophaga]TIA95330.1 hypothetical protein E3P96_03861 [Wallemia ichthyophaga]TIA97905.1 hypothetical protein E3P95_02636 [Wallemia ichthyophaga]
MEVQDEESSCAVTTMSFHTLEREKKFTNPSAKGNNYPILQELVKPHVDSFNMLFKDSNGDEGLLDKALRDIPSRVVIDDKHRLELTYKQLNIAKPMVLDKDKNSLDRRVFPFEARERLTTYKSRMSVKIQLKVDGQVKTEFIRECGSVPVMVRSERCNLQKMSSAELVAKHEESDEMGGYFIINGNEKLMRLLVVPRRHYVTSIIRPSFANRGPTYTEFGVQIRCVRPDQTSTTNTMHYLSNGGATLRFAWRKNEYMIPVIMVMKALSSASDRDIFEGIIQKDYDNTFLTDRVELLLRGFKPFRLYTKDQCLFYLGSKFRVVLGCPDDWSDIQVGQHLIERCILVHLKTPEDKYRMLLFMLQKLYSLVSGESCADNPDSPQLHEVLMPGFLYGQIIKEKLDECLIAASAQIRQDLRRQVSSTNLSDDKYVNKVIQRTNFDIGQKLNYFLATGNLVSPSGLDLQQATGFTIMAEKLNFYRYLSHFRCIHRGAFFAELKTTAVRKLLPEAWGFLCPVHTPDGAPCGLLNHLSRSCKVTTENLEESASKIPALLSGLGMIQPFIFTVDRRTHVAIHLDGRVIGWANTSDVKHMAEALRIWKTEGLHDVPLNMEIGLVPSSKGGQYPGLYLFTSRARMMRPVKYLANGKLDHLGSFEQVYMDVACVPKEIEKGISTHVEFTPTNVLSVVANMTPFSDFNQSPRNMYQCQMAKQTMGTPSTAIMRRTDNKLYRIQNGQSPIVRPNLHNNYGMDNFPQGANAIVAVLSYTGYDMEDAMIINKSAHERGFGYGTVYKSQIVDLREMRGANKSKSTPSLHFGLGADAKREWRETLDDDGIVPSGVKVTSGDPICAYIDETTQRTMVEKYKGDEDAYIDEIRLLGSDGGDSELQKIHFKIRIPRSPVVGDKFSSRHGQKGVMSQRWKKIDLPFSESGLQPDVIINPHAFPSRMTIGMFVESIAGKAGALHGLAQDGTPFNFNESDTPVEYFGDQLKAAGYNYHGNEPMYSGVTGEEFPADIYLGCVYYQRLRHMVNDKYQVRTLGPVDQLTRQPIKGRKRHGGIRLGEMERDALIAHGTSFLLQDRLMNCSDYSTAWVCRDCGSLISLGYTDERDTRASQLPQGPTGEYCRVCRQAQQEEDKGEMDGEATQVKRKSDIILPLSKELNIGKGGNMDVVAVPYVLRYLASELACMGIRMSIELS